MSETTNGSGALLQLEAINTYYGQMHILQDANLQRRRGRARVPARRERVGEVDHAQDRARDRAGRGPGR